MSTSVRFTNPLSTIDAQPDGTLLMIFRGKYDAETGAFDEVRILLTPDGYMDLLASLANHARHGVADILGRPCYWSL